MLDQGRGGRFPYVLFDLGSTLIYFEGDWPAVIASSRRAATLSLRAQGYALDEQAFPAAFEALIQEYYQLRSDKLVEYTAEYVLREALRAQGIQEVESAHLRAALKAMYGVSQAFWRREEDAVPVLEMLRSRGHRLGIVSNAADDDDVKTLVDNAALRPYFDFVLTSATAGMRKPAPEIFLQALGYWRARPEQAVMIGDTVHADVAGANRLGIASVWITRRGDTLENRQVAHLAPPRAVINTLSDLPDLLAHWSD